MYILVNGKNASNCKHIDVRVVEDVAEIICKTDGKPCKNYPDCIHKLKEEK